MANHPKTVSEHSFKGLNNVLQAYAKQEGYLKRVNNIDLNKTGDIHKRKGYTLVDSGNYTSLWSTGNGDHFDRAFAVKDGDIGYLDDQYHFHPITTGLGLTQKLSFLEIDKMIYFSSMEINGKINKKNEVVDYLLKCSILPNVSIVSGSLLAGKYQLLMTFVNADGLESGSGNSLIVDVPTDGSGITFLLPSVPYKLRVYMSTRDGTELYFVSEAHPYNQFTILDVPKLVNPFRMFNLDAPPIGSVIRYFKSRMYVAYHNILWYSEPFMYEHFRLDTNFIEYPADIIDILPVDDGMYIASDKLYYIEGHDPDSFRQETKELARIYKGTASKVFASHSKSENLPNSYSWLVTSDQGILALFNQGQVVNMTLTNVDIEPAIEGDSIFMEIEGINQYLTNLVKLNSDKPNTSVVGDLVESQIIRNGIVIN